MPTNVHPINPDMTPLTAQDLAVPALLVLEMLDSGEFKCGPGRCARCCAAASPAALSKRGEFAWVLA